MIKKLVKLLKALNGNVNPGEIAHAIACGAILGLMPKDNLFWYLVFVFILFVRINKPAYLLTILLGAAVSPAFDGFFDTVGCLISSHCRQYLHIYWTFLLWPLLISIIQ